MPRVKSFSQHVAQHDRDELVHELAAEIANEQTVPLHEPLIYEEEIGPQKHLHVVVFWNKWASMPRERRGSVIMDAYEQADPPSVSRILIAMGLTFDEGVEMNFLPYQVQALVKETDPVDREQIKKAMIAEGAIQISRGLQLRFPSLEMAQAAYSRLTAKFPGPYFAIAQTVAQIED